MKLTKDQERKIWHSESIMAEHEDGNKELKEQGVVLNKPIVALKGIVLKGKNSN